MAPFALASASRPNPTRTFTHDVFLSFRGEDTRHTFTDHLYDALVQTGLRIFRDNDAIDRGEELAPEIMKAIEESKASIVVLSENYSNSRWCLNELWSILEQRRKGNHFVLPVFYHVDPSDVRNQRGTFTIKASRPKGWMAALLEAFTTKVPISEADMRRWKAALTEVANLTGMEVSGSEANFIAEVVETVQRKLDVKHLISPSNLIGMAGRAEVIKYWLEDEQTNVIAIYGMGGSGKTTLAQYIYDLKKQGFESSSFILGIGRQPDGLLGFQKQLLKDVCGGKKIRISSVLEGTRKIEEVLQMKRMLIVLDDIENHHQLSALLGTKAFHTHSKIIITTKLLSMRAYIRSISLTCQVYETKLLNDLQSLELLSLHAFGSKTPMKEFKQLALRVTKYCGGNPLALQVLGSSLFVCAEDQLTRDQMILIWESRLSSLNSLKGYLDHDIQGVLRKSFDCLPLPSDKELFLHIACFFVGKYENEVITILEDELQAQSGLLTLMSRCLLKVSSDGIVMMHQLLQEMGKSIVREEARDPAKRSRVWCDAESFNVLRKKDGSDKVKGLALDMRKVEQEMRSKTLETSSLANMEKLILLQLKYVKLTGSYDKFPKLKWLCWYGCPLKAMPSGLLMSSLVDLDLSCGDMETFEVPTVLHSLEILQLTGCGKLVSIYNIGRLPKLRILSLWNCSSLTHICKTIGDLKSLVSLDLKGCTKLWKYPDQLEITMLPEQSLFSLPQSISSLDLTNCDLETDSDVCVAFDAQSISFMCLGCNPFEFLPNSIDLRMIRVLNLYCCSNLKTLPCIPSTLHELYVDWCISLKIITFQSGCFSLGAFSCKGCLQLSEVQGLFTLVPIAKVDVADLVQHMQWIKAYEDYRVDLVGDEITEGRIWFTQILYEYGIMSTFLQNLKYDHSMPTYDYTTSSDFASFSVPCHQEKSIIQGLSVYCLYRSSISMDEDTCRPLLAKISNKTKGLTWIYNPMVYCKPMVDEDVVWLSYWPIGNILDAGDEVSVEIIEVQEEENISVKEDQEVIGGDLSEFMVSNGGYYLCRRDFFYKDTSYWLVWMFGDSVQYTESQGWRKTHVSHLSMVLKNYANTFMKIIEVGLSLNRESEIENIKEMTSKIDGVESVLARNGKLTVVGCVDPVEVVTCAWKFGDKSAEILSVKIILDSDYS
ncbi:hypothetical protein SSX86_020642 [Deinandra increscens subsp. villosa]|uniref:TIR domain-containing protein n=1 Tax=Deinandra increscens subsp. villosa TaxID=3103831 RepID=A0AAP0GR02_9ASTR